MSATSNTRIITGKSLPRGYEKCNGIFDADIFGVHVGFCLRVSLRCAVAKDALVSCWSRIISHV